MIKCGDVIDGWEDYEEAEGEMSSVLRREQELCVPKLIERGLSNLNALNKNKLVQIMLCSRQDAHGKPTSLQN